MMSRGSPAYGPAASTVQRAALAPLAQGSTEAKQRVVALICAHGADEVIECSPPLTDDTSDREIGA